MNQVRAERVRRGWSLNRLAQLTGIAASDLSQLERGERRAFPAWRRRLSVVLKLREEEHFGERVNR